MADECGGDAAHDAQQRPELGASLTLGKPVVGSGDAEALTVEGGDSEGQLVGVERLPVLRGA